MKIKEDFECHHCKFLEYSTEVRVSAKPNTKCLSAHMQLLIINILGGAWGKSAARRAQITAANKGKWAI